MSIHPVTQLRRYDERFQALPRTLPAGDVNAGTYWRGIAFRIGQTQLTASMEQVSEVLTDPLVSRVPGAKPWVRGLANVRGRLVTIVDLPLFLNLERASTSRGMRALFVESGDISVGLLVDQVYGARQFVNDERHEDSGDIADALRPYVTGRMTSTTESWAVLDIGRILADPTFLSAAA